MLVQILLLLVGLALVVFGADYLVDGASAVARRFGLSEFVIGLTIVGMGTSAPEMVVSFIGAAQGNADIAIGNVVGSNIFNTLLILGLTALLLPMDITRENRKKDIPVNILITVLLIVLGLELTFFGFGTDGLSRIDGAILVALFVAYMWSSFAQKTPEAQPESESKPIKPWLAVIMILGGLGGLVAGGKLFVNSATAIAHALGRAGRKRQIHRYHHPRRRHVHAGTGHLRGCSRKKEGPIGAGQYHRLQCVQHPAYSWWQRAHPSPLVHGHHLRGFRRPAGQRPGAVDSLLCGQKKQTGPVGRQSVPSYLGGLYGLAHCSSVSCSLDSTGLL